MKRCQCGVEIDMIKTAGGKYMPAEIPLITIIDKDGNVHKGRQVHWGRCKEEDSFRKPEDKPITQEPCHHAGVPADGKDRKVGPLCMCGHYECSHQPERIRRPQAGARGRCRVEGCSCERFMPIPRGPDEGPEGGP
jgi:hypothetical protein